MPDDAIAMIRIELAFKSSNIGKKRIVRCRTKDKYRMREMLAHLLTRAGD